MFEVAGQFCLGDGESLGSLQAVGVASGRFLGVGGWRRFDPMWRWERALALLLGILESELPNQE